MYGIARNFVDRLLSSCAQGLLNGRAIKTVIPILSAAALTACAIHPVQQDVTRVPAKSIVNRIRCEARLAVLDKAIKVLRQTAEDSRTPPVIAGKFDVIAGELESQRGGPIRLDPRRLPTDDAKSFYSRYINTVIVYDFLMQGVENNKLALRADPFRFITNGTAGITLGGSGEFNRDNQRHFALADTFEELLHDPMQCESRDYLPENFIYPVSGRVGLREVVDTFVELNEFKPLSQFKEDKTVFADTLKFTTTWIGSATPHVQIDAVGSRFGLDSPTDIGLSASRADTHTLTLGLAMGPPLALPLLDIPLPLAVRPLRPRRSSASTIQQTNKDAAFDAIQELRIRSFLDRAGTLVVR